jgi:hypothetical protein
MVWHCAAVARCAPWERFDSYGTHIVSIPLSLCRLLFSLYVARPNRLFIVPNVPLRSQYIIDRHTRTATAAK